MPFQRQIRTVRFLFRILLFFLFSISCLLSTLNSPALAAWPSDPVVNVPVTTIAPPGPYTRYDLDSDGAGGAVFVWNDARNNTTKVYVQKVDGNGNPLWGETGLLAAPGRNTEQYYPRIMSDGEGWAIITWNDYESGVARAYMQRVDASGNLLWGETGKFIGEVYVAQPTMIVNDSEGGFYVVWGEGWQGPFKSERFDKDGNPVWPGAVVLPLTVGNMKAEAIPDGAGGFVVAYTKVLRVDKNGNVLWDRTITNVGGERAVLANDGQGGYIVAGMSGGGTWVHRLDASGNELWPGGVNIPNAHPYVLRGMQGGAIVMYIKQTCNSGDACFTLRVHVQRLDANGSPMWGPEGIKPFGDISSGDIPVMIDDYSGGALIAWGNGGDIIAQRIDKDGNILWSSPFIYVSNAVGYQQNPRITVDGEGGAVIMWSDLRDLSNWIQFYSAQRVLADGTLGGGVEGFYVSSIFRNRGGDTGNASVLIKGNGFTNESVVKLVGPGGEILGENTSLVGDSTGLATTFNLLGKARGLYDVVVIKPNGAQAVLPEGFTVEEGKTPQVWVDIGARYIVNLSRRSSFFILFGNRGNVDAHGVPLFISLPKETVTWELGFDIIPPPLLPGVDPIDWSQVPINVETDTENIIPLFIPVIPPGYSGVFEIKLRTTVRFFDIRAKMGRPMFGSGLSSSWGDCLMDVFMNTILSLPTIFGDEFLTGGCVGLAYGFFVDGFSQLVQAYISQVTLGSGRVGRPVSHNQYQFNVQNFVLARLGDVPECAFTILWPEGKIAKAAAQISVTLLKNLALSSACQELYLPVIVRLIEAGISIDPNEKDGPTGVGPEHYVLKDQPLTYPIFFENLETATLPAQEVTVEDQLDTAILDLSTFSLGNISFGNTEINITPGTKNFTKTIDLRPAKNIILRIEASLDTNTGLARWYFKSIDPDTGELPEDPTVGFLPPNVNSPEGEGKVMFTVMPKEGLPGGTEIRNSASIVFDVNAPILTNEWLNTIAASEIFCNNQADEDGDGLADCADPDCACDPACADADGDGFLRTPCGNDCNDLDPDIHPGATEICDDGVDNDCDGLTDCGDGDCTDHSACPEICSDGTDNDGNGLVDCQDPECNKDADGDGFKVQPCGDDCNDADPDIHPGAGENCSDGVDNDCDNVFDCDDTDCDGQCPEAGRCNDGRDNDGDTLVDCNDPECFGLSCPEICSDGKDNEGDGLVDCEDPDCPPCCEVGQYLKGISSINFGYAGGQKDNTSLRMCFDETLCDGIRKAYEEHKDITLRLNDCEPIIIPWDRLRSSRNGTWFRARSARGEKPYYSLLARCSNGWLILTLGDIDLKDCIAEPCNSDPETTYPVKACVSVKDGPCYCAEEEFIEERYRSGKNKGKLKRLYLKVREACPP